ncbi:MAG: response regulator [Deltaproteobacteria bacterium]|nr:response regulator [Deltaproteobacteria bacterium]
MKRVLVVEDNKNNMRLLVKLLNKHGYETIKAETGEEGVQLAIEEKPDLILMDIKLPGIDGMEATKRIRASESNGKVPIIAITSYAMAGDRERYLKEGFTGYIEKPIDPYKIIKEIEEIWRKKSKS